MKTTEKQIKLSPKQLDIIKRLRSGVRIHVMSGPDSYCFISDDMKNVPWPTIFKLSDMRLIKKIGDYNRETYELTELGKSIDITEM